MKRHFYFVFILLLAACSKPTDKTTQQDNTTNSTLTEKENSDTVYTSEATTSVDLSQFPLHEGKREIAMPIAYIWEYKYTPEDPNEEKIEFEMWAYYEPKTKSWGLFPDWTFGASGGMYDYIFCKPDGTYLLQSSDEHRVSSLDKYEVYYMNESKLPDYYKATGNTKSFDVDQFNLKAIEAEEYKVSFMKMEGETTYFLADSDIDLTPLYQFSELIRLNILRETQMPIEFPNDLPGNKLLLYNVTESKHPKSISEIKLTAITPTASYIYLLPEEEAVSYSFED